jgi:hypothetical protein
LVKQLICYKLNLHWYQCLLLLESLSFNSRHTLLYFPAMIGTAKFLQGSLDEKQVSSLFPDIVRMELINPFFFIITLVFSTIAITLMSGGVTVLVKFLKCQIQLLKILLIGFEITNCRLQKRGLLSIINHYPSTLEAPHCGERSTAV